MFSAERRQELFMRKQLVGVHFENAPSSTLQRIHYCLNILQLKKFDRKRLFVEYEIGLPEGYSTDKSTILNGVSQTVKTKKGVGNISFPVSFTVIGPLAPTLSVNICFVVYSYDIFRRMRVEGYGSLVLPIRSTMDTVTVGTWRPFIPDMEWQRALVGGTGMVKRIKSLLLLGNTLQGSTSFYGLQTKCGGDIMVEVNAITQRKKSVRGHRLDKRKRKRKSSSSHSHPSTPHTPKEMNFFSKTIR
ncbi:hypothetical protein PCE1_001534 [Barthelona sp. PCE]